MKPAEKARREAQSERAKAKEEVDAIEMPTLTEADIKSVLQEAAQLLQQLDEDAMAAAMVMAAKAQLAFDQDKLEAVLQLAAVMLVCTVSALEDALEALARLNSPLVTPPPPSESGLVLPPGASAGQA